MNAARYIDSSIQLLKLMLGDPNNELKSEQQRKLKKGIRDLKHLRKAKELTHGEVHRVVSEIAEAAIEILNNELGE